MNVKIKFYLSDIEFGASGAPEPEIQKLLGQLDFQIPGDYLDLMREHNGGEGEIGDHSWLTLFPITELAKMNKANEILMNQIPDYYLFGKDSADTAYAFHKRKGTFHSFGFMSNFKNDIIEFCGNNFIEFLEYLYNYKFEN